MRGLIFDWGTAQLTEVVIALSPERCIAWVGDTLLETLSSKSGISETEFLHEWQKQLPEQWKKLALCSELKVRSKK